MTALQLSTVLEAMGFTPEDYSDQLYSSGSYDSPSGKHFDNKQIEMVVGPWTEIEKDREVSYPDSYGESYKRTVLHFTDHNIYLAGHIYSGSYGSDTWTSWYEVEPVPSVEFRRVGDATTESDNSY